MAALPRWSSMPSFPHRCLTVTDLTTDQSSTAHLLPVSSPWMYSTSPSSISGEAETTSPSNGSSTFHSWLMDLSNRTTSSPTLFQEGAGFFMWPLVALLTAFVTAFLVGCILGCCQPTCVTRKTYTTTYVRQRCPNQETSISKEIWSPTTRGTVGHSADPSPEPGSSCPCQCHCATVPACPACSPGRGDSSVISASINGILF